jgi:hypothetical protein
VSIDITKLLALETVWDVSRPLPLSTRLMTAAAHAAMEAAKGAMEAAKGAMETAHSGAAHAAVESIHAMEAACEAVAHEGLADEAAMANEAGLTDEAVAHEGPADEAAMANV